MVTTLIDKVFELNRSVQHHFATGSIGSKVEAAIRFLEGGGERVITVNSNELMQAPRGQAGTLIVAENA